MKSQQLTHVFKADTHKKRVYKAYFIIFISAIIYTIGIQGFIQVAKVFSAGLGAFAQLPTLMAPETLGQYFSLFYLAFNLPLIVIFWKKNKAKFMYRTMFFLIVQTAIGALFFIPEIGGDKYGEGGIFSDLMGLGWSNHINNAVTAKWPIVILAILGALFVASSMGLSWKYGGSTGGTDIIAYYYSTKKQKAIGTTMMIISFMIIGFSFAITIGVNEEMRKHWLMSLTGSMAYIMISGMIMDKIYPKFKKVEARIVSPKWKEIIDELEKADYNHSWRTSEYTSRKGVEGREIITVAFWLETKDLVKLVHKVDPEAWISLNEVRAVVGRLNAPKLEN